MTEPVATYRILELGDQFAERLYGVITEAKNGNPLSRVTVITPGFYSSFYLRRWIAAQGLVNVEFMRIDDMAEALAQEKMHVDGGKPMTRIKGAELVRASVVESKVAGTLEGLVMDSSFLLALQRTLGDLESEQSRNIEVSFDRVPDRGEVTRAVGDIWESYQHLKARHRLYDRTQVAGWASEAVRSGALDRSKAKLEFGAMVVLAAAVPSPQYREFWQTLITNAPGITVLPATGDERSDNVLGQAFGVDVAGTNVSVPPPGIVSAADVRSEIAALVQRITTTAETENISFNRIAVYYGNQAYASRVRAALEMANIPIAGPPAQTLLDTSLGRFVSGVLKIASSDLERRSVGDWLAVCAVKDPVSGEVVTGTEWDRISRAARISKGAERWVAQLERFVRSSTFRAQQLEQREDDDSAGPSKADALRTEVQSARRLLAFVQELAIDLQHPEMQNWGGWAGWLKIAIDRYFDAPDGTAAVGLVDRTHALLDRISELDNLRLLAEPDLARFEAVVRSELAQTRSGKQQLGRGVFVANIRDAAGTQFKHVHILGMSDGSFPSPDTADPLLSDQFRQVLNTTCGTSLTDSGMRRDLHRREFMAALMSGVKATLYWPRSSGPGSNQVGPAQWLVEQAKRQPGAESVQAGDLLERPEMVPGLYLAEYGSGDFASDRHEYEVASVRRHIEMAPRSHSHRLENDCESGVPAALLLERGRFGELFTEWSGDLSLAVSEIPGHGGEVLSASRVETFARCPLRYFFNYVLHVEPVIADDHSFHMPPDRKGSFIHKVLEVYLGLRLADNETPPGEETLYAAMHRVMEEWEDKDPDVIGRVWEIETSEIRRQLRRWLAKEKELAAAGYSPSDAELSFGRDSSDEMLPPLEIELKDGTVMRFTGMIDRVEKRSDGSFYVLDYKSGLPDSYSGIKRDPVDRGKHLQLALYSKAIEQFRKSDTLPVAGYWFVLDAKQTITPSADEFDPVTASDGFLNVLEVLHESNTSGYFPPNPGESAFGSGGSTFKNCMYCDFNKVCPANYRRERMLNIHKDDSRVATYFDLALDRDKEEQ